MRAVLAIRQIHTINYLECSQPLRSPYKGDTIATRITPSIFHRALLKGINIPELSKYFHPRRSGGIPKQTPMSFQPKWCNFCGANTHSTKECPIRIRPNSSLQTALDDDTQQEEDRHDLDDENKKAGKPNANRPLTPITVGIHTPLKASNPLERFEDPPCEGSPAISAVGPISVVDSETPLLSKFAARSDDQPVTSADGSGNPK